MNRAQSLVDHAAAQELIAAGIDRFHERGYTDTSVRQIAEHAGRSQSGFYTHFPSKLAILAEIARSTYASGLAEVQAAVDQAGEDPRDRLDALIWAQCDFAMRRRCALLVIDAELLTLEPRDRADVRVARERLGDLIDEAIVDGTLSGVFSVDRPAIVSQALAGMCASISAAYDSGGMPAPRQTAETYCALAARMVGARSDARARRLAVVPEPLVA